MSNSSKTVFKLFDRKQQMDDRLREIRATGRFTISIKFRLLDNGCIRHQGYVIY